VHRPQFLLAAKALVIRVSYLAADKNTLAWIAFAIHAVGALPGWTMFAIRSSRRQSRAASGTGVSADRSASAAPTRPKRIHSSQLSVPSRADVRC